MRNVFEALIVIPRVYYNTDYICSIESCGCTRPVYLLGVYRNSFESLQFSFKRCFPILLRVASKSSNKSVVNTQNPENSFDAMLSECFSS